MEIKFLFEDEFRGWYKNINKTTDHETSECATRIKKILNGVDNIPDFEKEYLTYVPALMSIDKNKGFQLLSYVYADGYLSGNRCSHLQHYFNFCAQKRKWDGVKELDNNCYDEIKGYLDNRIVWICNNNFKDNFSFDKNAKKYIYKNRFSKLFISRIDSWGRNYFPLGIIKEIIDDQVFTGNWKKDIIKTIKVITEPNDSSSEYDLWNIAFFDFRRIEDGRFRVFAITKKREYAKVFTSCLGGEPKEMLFKTPGDMTIDHKKSLYKIVQEIKDKRPDIKEILEHLTTKDKCIEPSAFENPGSLKETLKKLLRMILKETKCELMEKGENSRKSNKI